MTKAEGAGPCDHKWVYLRKDRKFSEGHYNNYYEASDVFFCERCLEYKTANTQTANERGAPRWYRDEK